MAGLAVSSLRVGEKYRITNYGEVYDVQLVNIHANGNCEFKDLYTLETITYTDIVQFGKGGDYKITEY